MARRATVIKNARAASENVLVLDAGNSLYGPGSNVREPAQRTKGLTSVELLNRMGYDAVALGGQDVLVGREELLQRLCEAKSFAFVSANLTDNATNELLAKPYLIKDAGSHQVALVGITGELPEEAEGFTLTDPLQAAQRYVPEVAAKADIVILLSNAGAEVNATIADQVPGIDLIISGGLGALPQPKQVNEGTLLVQAEVASAGSAGRTIGDLSAEFDISGELTEHSWHAVKLDPSIADDAAMVEWVDSVTAAPAE